MSIAFLITTLVMVATRGAGAVYSIAAGLSRGTKAGITAASGCAIVIESMLASTRVTDCAAFLWHSVFSNEREVRIIAATDLRNRERRGRKGGDDSVRRRPGEEEESDVHP